MFVRSHGHGIFVRRLRESLLWVSLSWAALLEHMDKMGDFYGVSSGSAPGVAWRFCGAILWHCGPTPKDS
ncbi:hypothetical protein CBR_g34021 [Chara braunii]|uniref:Uncharacterized protein n=1 Tax=Chara braunii TaxID=69332 RepID=A0A388LHM7_CHABU|nr:hypothetical protein CBR_g34021 [Chara braunii]|eukprot:GBG81840.1 hypothetical protein CBR_g34021 [Chara braunii]